MKAASVILQVTLVSVCLAFSAGAVQGQKCKELVYGHENQIDPKPIELRQVTGKVLDPSGTAIPQVCVGIFTEPDHKLVRYAQTDESGRFVIDTKGLPDGQYRLVGQSPGFCPANALIQSQSRSHRKRALVLHMNVRGIDACSYVDASKN